ncbi:outer membrane beta-barrel protein [Pedobacter petrophilus]|uniref:Outer membrane beta-barrel protein n=1 Tax=Pedobacter petrophilus TaxID=1908241 RepID=A0A7K0FV91_9SPHI|nr:porin [Pedobacter petrophilus]MRX74666.1 outer membrane beta-barrel protein [Pedobacter petrophilus]
MKKFLTAVFTMASTTCALAQEAPTSPLEISGSVDTYFKYDFAKQPNIKTSFASDHNSVSLGMIDLVLKKRTGKASFVGELSFGPRGQAQSLPNAAEDVSSFHIQNLYVNYDFTDKFSMTAGYMGTFIGYEVISPVGNFNYSTSYLFTNGPFQNAGIKATYKFSDKVSLMAGLFNDWNVYTATRGVSSIGGQLMVSPVEGWTAYLNVLSGAGAGGYGTIEDLTTSYQISKTFKLGLNAANYDIDNDGGGYAGVALYPQFAVADAVTLGLRGEYFKYKEVAGVAGDKYTAVTFTANIKSGGLTFIPEVRLDHNGNKPFVKDNGLAVPNAGQFSLAAVYAF